jgi:hypothetical protein
VAKAEAVVVATDLEPAEGVEMAALVVEVAVAAVRV